MHRKRYLRIAFLCVVMSAFMAVPALAQNDLSLQVTSGSTLVSPGATVTVTLDIAGLSSPINGVQAFLHYDNTLLTLTGVAVNTTIGVVGWSTGRDTDTAGDVDFVAAMNGGSTQLDHTIATLTFTADAVGTTSIIFRTVVAPVFHKLTLVDNSSVIPNTTNSSAITIQGEPHVASLEVFYSGSNLRECVGGDTPGALCQADIQCPGTPTGTCTGPEQADPNIFYLGAGSVATVNNVSYYIRGITGIRVYFDTVVDFSTLDPTDAFSFEWTNPNGSTFTPVTNVASTFLVSEATKGGVTVVTIVIDNDTVMKRWLKTTIDAAQVSVAGALLDGDLAGNPISMPSGDTVPGGNAVFYLASMPGDVQGDLVTTLDDVSLDRIESNPTIAVLIDNVFDVNKDGAVTLDDVSVTRMASNPTIGVPLITPVP